MVVVLFACVADSLGQSIVLDKNEERVFSELTWLPYAFFSESFLIIPSFLRASLPRCGRRFKRVLRSKSDGEVSETIFRGFVLCFGFDFGSNVARVIVCVSLAVPVPDR